MAGPPNSTPVEDDRQRVEGPPNSVLIDPSVRRAGFDDLPSGDALGDAAESTAEAVGDFSNNFLGQFVNPTLDLIEGGLPGLSNETIKSVTGEEPTSPLGLPSVRNILSNFRIEPKKSVAGRAGDIFGLSTMFVVPFVGIAGRGASAASRLSTFNAGGRARLAVPPGPRAGLVGTAAGRVAGDIIRRPGFALGSELGAAATISVGETELPTDDSVVGSVLGFLRDFTLGLAGAASGGGVVSGVAGAPRAAASLGRSAVGTARGTVRSAGDVLDAARSASQGQFRESGRLLGGVADRATAPIFDTRLGGLSLRTGSAVAGGLIAGPVGAAVGAVSGAGIIRRVREKLSPMGQRRLAAERVRAAGIDPANPPTTDGVAGTLNPTQRLGTPEALALDAEIGGTHRARWDRNFIEDDNVSETVLHGIRGGSTVEAAKLYLRAGLKTLKEKAAGKIQQGIEAAGNKLTPAKANMRARFWLRRAKQVAVTQERQLFSRVNMEAESGTLHVRGLYLDLRDELGDELVNRIPKFIRTAFGTAEREGTVSELTTVGKLREFQSELREVARRAAADNKGRRASIANRLANAINDDLAMALPGDDTLQIAVAYSREFHQAFNRGHVSRILGTSADGGGRVRADLTIDDILSGGTTARSKFEEIMKAARMAQNQPTNRRPDIDGAAVIAGAVEQGLREKFRATAINALNDDGTLNRGPLKEFLKQHREVLGLPEMKSLKKRMDTTIRTGRIFSNISIDSAKRNASKFLNAPVAREIQTVVDSDDPAQAMRNLLAQAKFDPSGETQLGVRAALMDWVIGNIRSSTTEFGPDFQALRGSVLRDIVNDPRTGPMIKAALTKDQMNNLRQVQNTLIRLDAARSATAAARDRGGPPAGEKLIVALLGALVGRSFNTRTIQGPGRTVGFFERMIALPHEKIERLVVDAILDRSGEAMKALNIRPQASRAALRRAEQRLNAWLIGSAEDDE